MPELEPSLDEQIIADLRETSQDTGVDLIGELAAMLFNGLPKALATLRAAAVERDSKEVAAAAHKIKGAAAGLGAARIARFCGEIQQIATGRSVERVSRLIDEVETEAGRVKGLMAKKGLTRGVEAV